MKLSVVAAAVAAFVAASLCAAAAKQQEPSVRIPSEDEAGRILNHARKLRAEKGCAEAAPAYRVAAAMGEGFEVAQRELGGCLVEMAGASDAETQLFRKEGMFWLERAAFAGNAAAQRALSMELAKSPQSAAEALKWALAFERSGETKLYGYAPLIPAFTAGLKATLTPQQIADAEAFAAAFSTIRLAPYSAPPRPRPGEKPSVMAPRPMDKDRPNDNPH